MKKTTKRILAVLLCVVLVVCSCGITAFALTKSNNEEKLTSVAQKANDDNESDKITKDETVYVLANSDGSVKKVIVSDWIKNSLNSQSISDSSELTDVENVKGDETYTLNGDNMRVWDAQGKDLYYQGNIEKDIPVNMSISYTLDGAPISPSDLAGKSGHVVMRFDYENSVFTTANICGKQEKINIPFVMLTGMLLDSNVFKNVDISNGKILNDGDHTAVVGLALPGMQNNLNISKDDVDIPDYVEISADVEDFELSTTITIATNDVFNKIDLDGVNSVDDLKDSLSQMSDAMSQLMDGSSKLYDGLCTLLSKSSELINGIDTLVSGVSKIKDGANDLDTGVGQLKAGAQQLSTGLDTLVSNNEQLNGGAKQIFDTLLSTANQQIGAAGITIPELTINNYSDVLNGVINSLDETNVYNQALSEVTNAVNAQYDTIVKGVSDVVKQNVTQQVTVGVREQVKLQVTAGVKEVVMDNVIKQATSNAMDLESYKAAIANGSIDENMKNQIESITQAQMQTDSVVNQIDNLTNSKMESNDVKVLIDSTVDSKMSSPDVKAIIDQNVEIKTQQLISEAMASDGVQSKLQEAAQGAQQIISLKKSLDSYNAFYLGLLTYTQGVATASEGANSLNNGVSILKDGTSTLCGGVNQLYDGVLKMQDNAPALITGVTQLKDGAMKLSDGLSEFNNQGVQKIIDAYNGDIEPLVERLRATIDASKNYKSFSGIDSEMDGQVKFIYRTDAIEK